MTLATADTTVVFSRPGFEGANIRTWIGFKHFIYLVEQAVLQWLRERGTSARELYHEYGLGFEIVDCSVQLPAVIELDDDVRAQVVADNGRRLTVQLSVTRGGGEVTVLRGKVSVALVWERTAPMHAPAPPALAAYEVGDVTQAHTVDPRDGIDRRALAPGATPATVLGTGPRELLWSWRARYFHCHFSDRVQHSAYVRALEEVVDRFLADRGISVGRLLAERAWIPVVSRVRIQMIAAAHMEETVHTVFTLQDVLRGVMFDGRMDCYVQRGDELLRVATARILHGYAIAAGPGAGGMAVLDDAVAMALTGGRP